MSSEALTAALAAMYLFLTLAEGVAGAGWRQRSIELLDGRIIDKR